MIPGNLPFKGTTILFVVLLHSTDFIDVKLGLPRIDPITFLSLRFLITIFFLVPLMWWYHAPWPKKISQIGCMLVELAY